MVGLNILIVRCRSLSSSTFIVVSCRNTTPTPSRLIDMNTSGSNNGVAADLTANDRRDGSRSKIGGASVASAGGSDLVALVVCCTTAAGGITGAATTAHGQFEGESDPGGEVSARLPDACD